MKRQCVRPNLAAWNGESWDFVGPAARYSGVDFSVEDAHLGIREQVIKISCGHCICCRIARAQEWTIRGVHEMQSTFHPTYAVTLTYDQEHLPPHGSLARRDLKLFHKRLRHTSDFRFMACGEYGPTTGRAHYHGIYFGLKLPDAYKGKHWGSQTLLDAWGKGQLTFHPATPASIGYVCGYVVKKLRTERGVHPIMETVDLESGMVIEEEPVSGEFFQASLRPALGKAWIEQFYDQVIRDGFIIDHRGKPTYRIPSYYKKIMKQADPAGFEEFSERRLSAVAEEPDLSPEELATLGINVQAGIDRVSRAGV